ncbi:amino acid/amide ABC transporter membrane protein 2, HAAT family [Limimonas halophila]|uniref:Amino acid/amide ABC transporter membrane protein 2, HAAT family n=1 Tax=Limimonas halophila TaxID=1082479 RepID=A0A1G7TBN5_9PROT|nr:branched-chain amino acid ABC transporter permease [Limimonas halophila]SDG32718.1 amino acid/amide ABC transporter membrane protein 2, HAAT family [Limimonas halophila]
MISPLRTMSASRETAVMAGVVLAFALLPFILPLIGGYGELAVQIAVWAIFALGFDLLVGFTGFLSFGHAAFWGVSMYAGALTLQHVTTNALAAIVFGVIAGTIVAVVIGYLTLRRHGIYFAILTLAFSQMFYFIALSPAQDITGGDNGLTGIPYAEFFGATLSGWHVMYPVIAVIGVGAVYVARRIARSPYGLMLRAIKSNETRLQYTGINVRGYRLMAFVISGIFASLAGILFGIYETYVPIHSLHWATSGEVVMMSVIGGLGTLFGPMIGAAVVLYLENVLSATIAQWLLIQGAIFMAFVIFLPGGIADGIRRVALFVRRSGGAARTSASHGETAAGRDAVQESPGE